MEKFIPWIISALALLVAYLSYTHNTDKDDKTERDALHEGILKANLKLDQVCVTTTDIKSDIKTLDKRINEFDKELAVVKRDVKTAFSRIDELKKGNTTNE